MCFDWVPRIRFDSVLDWVKSWVRPPRRLLARRYHPHYHHHKHQHHQHPTRRVDGMSSLSGRLFVREGDMTKYADGGKGQRRHFVLFDDRIMWMKNSRMRTSTYQLRQVRCGCWRCCWCLLLAFAVGTMQGGGRALSVTVCALLGLLLALLGCCCRCFQAWCWLGVDTADVMPCL